MKTPDEIKKGLFCCSYYDMSCSECPYDGICRTASGQTPEDDAAALIDHLLTIYSQVSKALCGKENADLEELLQAVSQVKTRLAQVERERDAAVGDLQEAARDGEVCTACKHDGEFAEACADADFDCKQCKQPCMCKTCNANSNYEWIGLCEENTHDQPSM